MSIKNKFPIFSTYPNLIFLDSASTTQKPLEVIDAYATYYSNYNSNVGRGMYQLAIDSTKILQDCRQTLANFVGVHVEELMFVPNATHGLNLIVDLFSTNQIIAPNTKIFINENNHSSGVLPWLKKYKNQISYFHKIQDLEISKDTDDSNFIFIINHVSNINGDIFEVQNLRTKFPQALIILDSSQATASLELPKIVEYVDVLTFSAHKMYGPMGTGVLAIKLPLLEKLIPNLIGGGTVDFMDKQSYVLKNSIEKFEPGTPDVASIFTFSKAVKFIQTETFLEEKILLENIFVNLVQELKEIEDVELFPTFEQHQVPIVSFSIKNIHPHDIADFLASRNIAVRAGMHCNFISHQVLFENKPTVRLSLGIYNTQNDIEITISAIKELIQNYK